MKNPISWLISYFKESRSELQKVVWPTRQATARYVAVVVGVCVIVGAFFAGLDWALNLGLEKLIQLSA
jgi:preprotein translocase subunit SecE